MIKKFEGIGPDVHYRAMGRKALVVGQGCLPQTPPHDTSLAGLPTPPRELGGVFLLGSRDPGCIVGSGPVRCEISQILTIITIQVDYAS